MARAHIDQTGLTAVILTLNEEARLHACLDAIPSGYPVIVLDSGSTDRTVEIAKARGSKVVINPWPGFAAQRNFALDCCGIETDWVLFVDADEIYVPEFFEWFERLARGHAHFDAAMVASLLVFKGVTLRHAPGYPLYHPRLVRCRHAHFLTSHVAYGEAINAEARVVQVDIPYLHQWYDGDLDGWMRKHIGLAGQELRFLPETGKHLTTRARISRRLKGTAFRIPLRFVYHYFLRGGFRDGRAGLEYSLMFTWFEATKWVMAVAGPDARTQR